MKLVFFDDYVLGAVVGDEVVDLSEVAKAIPHTTPGSLINGLIADYDALRSRLEAAASTGTRSPLASVILRAPLPKPGRLKLH